MPDDLIKKSIRLPADLDEYVNSQKGTTWTDKLCRILEEYRSGDETRAEYMADYEKRMAANRRGKDDRRKYSDIVAGEDRTAWEKYREYSGVFRRLLFPSGMVWADLWFRKSGHQEYG